MKNRLKLIPALLAVLLLAGCASRVTREYSEETTRVISEEPVVGK